MTFDRKALCFDITPPGEDGLAELTITAAAKFIEYTSIIDELPDRLARPLLSCDPRRWRALRFEAPDYYLSDSLVDALRRVGEHFGDKARLPELREVAEARSAEVAG